MPDSNKADVYDHAVHCAHVWLADVAQSLGTGDRRFALRVMRVWLHALRDRCTVEEVVKFGAQLPELLRGAYYEGWDPKRAPIKYGPEEFTQRFVRSAHVAPADVPRVAGAVAAAMNERMAGRQVSRAFAQLPEPLRQVMGAQRARGSRPVPDDDMDRLGQVEEQLAVLTEVMRVLTQSPHDVRPTGSDGGDRGRATRLAAEILLTGTR
ncbi:MAG: DUF2267 domain-containing protein [Actinocatenispora sp.]